MTDEQVQKGKALQDKIAGIKLQKKVLNDEVKRTAKDVGVQIRSGYGNGFVHVSPVLGAVIITLVAAEINEKLRQAEEEFTNL